MCAYLSGSYSCGYFFQGRWAFLFRLVEYVFGSSVDYFLSLVQGIFCVIYCENIFRCRVFLYVFDFYTVSWNFFHYRVGFIRDQVQVSISFSIYRELFLSRIRFHFCLSLVEHFYLGRFRIVITFSRLDLRDWILREYICLLYTDSVWHLFWVVCG